MVIYTNNLAEKLFGFAMSRDQLKNTGLCDILQDPNLQLDIDLAIDFNASIRGDEDAAERFTNTLILSSAFLDYSTADFYTTRMEQYPVFEYHIDRITYIFSNIDNINDYYAAGSARDKSFIDSLKSALKDCLNSPCNLFAASSESIAAATDYVAASNSTTIPPFSALKDLVRITYGGLKNTLVKQLPDAVSNMIGKVAILGQDAFNQSIDVMFEKDKEKKDKLIANALAGKALDYDTTGYTYVPDIESFTSIEGFATSVLSQAASDLGGCFRKYQHLARYSPFDPNQNLSRTSTEPVQDSVDGQPIRRTSGGVTSVGGVNREEALNCDYDLAESDIAPPGSDQPNNGAGDLRGQTITSTNIRLDNDGITPPSFNDPYYQNQTSLPGLDATKDYFIVVPIGSKTPLGSKVLVTNPNTGRSVTAIVGDRGPVGASVGEVSFAIARDLDVWSGRGDSVKTNSKLTFKFDP